MCVTNRFTSLFETLTCPRLCIHIQSQDAVAISGSGSRCAGPSAGGLVGGRQAGVRPRRARAQTRQLSTHGKHPSHRELPGVGFGYVPAPPLRAVASSETQRGSAHHDPRTARFSADVDAEDDPLQGSLDEWSLPRASLVVQWAMRGLARTGKLLKNMEPMSGFEPLTYALRMVPMRKTQVTMMKTNRDSATDCIVRRPSPLGRFVAQEDTKPDPY
jgi:hypothetical protein